jgi:flagellar basal-body rod protein FlgC
MDGIWASLSGLSTSAQSIALSANNVANVNSAGFRSQSLVQETLPGGGVYGAAVQQSQAPLEPGGSNVDLATQAVNLDVQGTAYQADLKFTQVQNSLLGTALDMNG